MAKNTEAAKRKEIEEEEIEAAECWAGGGKEIDGGFGLDIGMFLVLSRISGRHRWCIRRW